MSNPLRILVLEDLATDYELMLRELRRAGLEFTSRRADSEESFRKQLHERLAVCWPWPAPAPVAAR